jgi:hypothetical protein
MMANSANFSFTQMQADIESAYQAFPSTSAMLNQVVVTLEKPKMEEYNIECLKVLEGMEPIRIRPKGFITH